MFFFSCPYGHLTLSAADFIIPRKIRASDDDDDDDDQQSMIHFTALAYTHTAPFTKPKRSVLCVLVFLHVFGSLSIFHSTAEIYYATQQQPTDFGFVYSVSISRAVSSTFTRKK